MALIVGIGTQVFYLNKERGKRQFLKPESNLGHEEIPRPLHHQGAGCPKAIILRIYCFTITNIKRYLSRLTGALCRLTGMLVRLTRALCRLTKVNSRLAGLL